MSGILRRGAVCGFEDGVFVGNVCARGDADAADLCRQRVGNVVAVQVEGGDDAVFGGTQQDLLQEGVGNRIFNDDVFAGFRVFEFAPRAAVDRLCAEFFLRQFIAPVAEAALGEFHDVAFVHQGNARFVVVDGVADGGANQALRTLFGNGFDADARGFGEADFLHAHFVLQEVDDFFAVFAFGFPFDAGVNVFGVFTEDYHVGFARVFQRRRHAVEVAHGAHALVEVEFLAQRDVERADAAAHGRGHRAFDGYGILFQCVQGFLRQPNVVAVHFGGFLAGIHFHPVDFFLATISLGNRRVDYVDHDGRDVHADAVALDEGDNRIVGNGLARNDFFAFRRYFDMTHGVS